MKLCASASGQTPTWPREVMSATGYRQLPVAAPENKGMFAPEPPVGPGVNFSRPCEYVNCPANSQTAHPDPLLKQNWWPWPHRSQVKTLTWTTRLLCPPQEAATRAKPKRMHRLDKAISAIPITLENKQINLLLHKHKFSQMLTQTYFSERYTPVPKDQHEDSDAEHGSTDRPQADVYAGDGCRSTFRSFPVTFPHCLKLQSTPVLPLRKRIRLW